MDSVKKNKELRNTEKRLMYLVKGVEEYAGVKGWVEILDFNHREA